MNVFNIQILAAGHGDSLWIEYGEAASPRRLLIDGGTAGTFKRLKPMLDGTRRNGGPSHELLVVTHVDADHIAGCLPILSDAELAKQFKEVWFNGRHHLQPDRRLEIMGAVQGETLSRAIESNQIPWNLSFNAQSIVLGEDGNPPRVSLPGGATLTILSPGWNQLKTMAKVWDEEVRKAGLKEGTKAVPPEIIKGFESLGPVDVDQLASIEFTEDDSAANGSSIAFLMEFEGIKALFAADAYPSVLLQSLRRLNSGDPIELDFFKIPHHGSKYNVSRELLEQAPSRRYAFSTNGAYFEHPDKEAVAKVIKYSRRGSELIFNCETEHNEMWKYAGLAEKWGYSATYGDGQAGIQVSLI